MLKLGRKNFTSHYNLTQFESELIDVCGIQILNGVHQKKKKKHLVLFIL